MATEIVMPQFGESVHEGTIGKWLKQPGETIGKYEPLVEVITDKVTAEVPSPVAGTLSKIIVEEGQTAPVGQPIAEVEERVAGLTTRPEPAVDKGAATPAAVASAQRLEGRPPERPTAGRAGALGNGHRPPVDADRQSLARHRSSPIVRRLAAEHALDIQQIEGTGLGGRVTKLDVLRYLAQRAGAGLGVQPPAATLPSTSPSGPGGWQPGAAAPPAAATAAGGPRPTQPVAPTMSPDQPPAREPAVERLAASAERASLSPIRRAIADHLTRSRQTIPDAWTMMEVDVSRLVALRTARKDEFAQREGVPLTYLPFMLAAVVRAVKQHPAVNAVWSDNAITQQRDVHAGIAVSLGDEGLVVPVITYADRLNLAGLAQAVHDLAARARAGKLRLEELQGGTITVNNPGSFGSVISQPIIPPGQTAIVTMEAIVKRPVVIDDAIAIRSMMNICCSFDHRVIDGETAGRFLAAVKHHLESFGPETAIY